MAIKEFLGHWRWVLLHIVSFIVVLIVGFAVIDYQEYGGVSILILIALTAYLSIMGLYVVVKDILYAFLDTIE
jgi:hypothetical protein